MSSSRVGAPSRFEAGAIAGAFFAASALGFALLALVARWLPPGQNASFLALWGLVFAFGSVLGAVEQEIARQATHATLEGRRVPIGGVQTIVVTSVGAHALLALLLVSAAGRSLTGHSAVITVLTLVALSGFSVQILARGVFLGRHSIARYVTVLVGEAVIRLLVGVLLVVQDVEPSLTWATVAIVAGCFSWLPVARPLVKAIDWHSQRDRWRRVANKVTALAIATGLSALTITGFPALATVVIGDARQLSDLFAVVTISRVPLVILAPVQAMTVPVAIRWLRTGQQTMLRRSLLWIATGSLVAAAGAALLGYWLGPWVTHLLMGSQYDPGRLTCALVLSATCLMAGALLQGAILIAVERYWVLAVCWMLAVAVAAVAMRLPASAETRGLSGLVAAAVVAEMATGIAVLLCAGRTSSNQAVATTRGFG